MAEQSIEVRVRCITYQTDTINSYELVSTGEKELPPFTAGAHINLHLSAGVIRSYSLVNDQQERHRYVIAVNRDANSRGGSSFVHDSLKVGAIIKIDCPRNNFELVEDASHSVLIAGGIGITPLLAMVRRLEALGRTWQLFYAARTRGAAAFLDELYALRANTDLNLRTDFDDERSGLLFDIKAIVQNAPPDAHLYCCGPTAMLQAFEAATADRSPDRVHVEYFQTTEAPATEGGFDVVLARSGRTITVNGGQTILDALLEAGVAVNYSCSSGVCGTCETRVIEGIPDHRDQYLSKDEQADNKLIMVCCSGAITKRLVLDL